MNDAAVAVTSSKLVVVGKKNDSGDKDGGDKGNKNDEQQEGESSRRNDVAAHGICGRQG